MPRKQFDPEFGDDYIDGEALDDDKPKRKINTKAKAKPKRERSEEDRENARAKLNEEAPPRLENGMLSIAIQVMKTRCAMPSNNAPPRWA
jgi:hypothetical protein